MNKKDIIKYYKKTLIDYQLIYFLDNNHSMHYGYWDKTTKNHSDACLKINAIIAEKLKLTEKDYVLDAGCGLGETSFWLAKNIDCNVKGISINPHQIKIAKKLAKKRGLESKVDFQVADYTNTSYPDNSFDAVMAIETICHLKDKKDFYREIYRILKPCGKLAVAEGILKKTPMAQVEKKELGFMLDGWAVPNLWTKKQHVQTMKNLRFSDMSFEDYSDNAAKTARYLYLHSIYGLPIYRILHKIGLLSEIRLKNALACKYQWIAKQKNLWGHAFIFGKKPKKTS